MKFSKTVGVVIFCATIRGISLSALAVELGGEANIATENSVSVQPTGAVSAVSASLPSQILHLKVVSSCTSEGALFEITNQGEEWPGKAFIGLYFVNGNSLFDYRRMRFETRQKASFVVPKTLSRGRSLGLWVDPKWYKRKFLYDTRVRC